MTSLAVLALLAYSGSLTVDGVTAAVDKGALTVEVTTSEPVEASALNAKLTSGRLNLYVIGARARTDRRHFPTADRDIEVLPRTSYAKVQVPFGEGLTCGGPVEFVPTPTGARASIACGNAAPRPVIPVAAVQPAVVARPAPVAQPAPSPAKPVVAAAPAPLAAPLAPKATPPEPPPLRPAARASSSMVLPGLLLVGVAGLVLVLGRRRAARAGMIQILETAPLGPKRALVIARVNGETMILGSSEAGITLLGGAERLAAASAPEAATSVEAPAPAAAAPAPALDEGGLLARLFRKRGPEMMEGEAPPADWKDFDELLGESLEDQELRRKLAAGRGAKVS